MRKDFIFDLETYPNCFTFCRVYSTGKGLEVYEISDRKNDIEKILDFLRNVKKGGYRLVGFNNISFDYPILHFILQKAKLAYKNGEILKINAKQIYKEVERIIAQGKENKFGSIIKSSEVIIPQVDLYLIHHLDNVARATSLKMLEFNMRSDNIEDLPFPVGMTLNDEQKDTLIEYNKHDVMETLRFYNYSHEALDLRDKLSVEFGFDCTNFNDTKIGKQLFVNRLEETNPGCCYTRTERGRKMNQTHRDKIVVKDCIFPYIKFVRPEFKAIHEWFTKQVISETKGVFSEIEEHKLGEVAKYAEMVIKRKKFKTKPTEQELKDFMKEHPLGWTEEEELKATEYLFDEEGNHVLEPVLDDFGNPDPRKKPKKKRVPKKSYYGCWRISETLNIVIDGFRYDYGTGGIHGAKQGTHISSATKKIASYDVASFYPNMSIANNIAPKHLGKTFCKVYSDLYQMRKNTPKGSAANAALKLALNGSYGASNDEYSPLYDPAYTMSITIGGQLSLCMLIETLIENCKVEMLMANTDGFEFFYDVQYEEQIAQYVKEWEQTTGLVMEGLRYKKMFIANVNSYIAIKE